MRPKLCLWVFNGDDPKTIPLPGGIFTRHDEAARWIVERGLVGILNPLPLNEGLFHWAVRVGCHGIKPEKLARLAKDPAEIIRFGAARLEHYHFGDKRDQEVGECMKPHLESNNSGEEGFFRELESPIGNSIGRELNTVWIATAGGWPGGIFEREADAKDWIARHRISCGMAELPVNEPVFDWARRSHPGDFPDEEWETMSQDPRYLGSFHCPGMGLTRFRDGNALPPEPSH